MDSGPSPITPGIAGTPLSHLSTESNRNAAHSAAHANQQPSEAISDTLETTDREAEGRQPATTNQNSERENGRDQGPLLDLSG